VLKRSVNVPKRTLRIDEFTTSGPHRLGHQADYEHGGQDELRARIGLNASGIEAAVKTLVGRNKKIKMAFP